MGAEHGDNTTNKIKAMNKKDLTAEDVLAIRIGRLVKENAELEQRVQELVEKYNDVVKQFMELKFRYDQELKTKNKAKNENN